MGGLSCKKLSPCHLYDLYSTILYLHRLSFFVRTLIRTAGADLEGKFCPLNRLKQQIVVSAVFA